MVQSTWVINVLDDSNRRSIEYGNRLWLRENVEKMNIRVCAEDCEVGFLNIASRMDEEGTILIQHGEQVGTRESGRAFWQSEEALLLVKMEDGYLVFLYLPKE